jgi:spore coat polysaccharide biosynthesis protein SpsF
MIGGKKVAATIEVRMTSTRLPGKVLMPLAGKPVLERLIERLRRSTYVDDVVVATTTNKTDDVIVELCKKLGCTYWRGSESDVLLRVLEAAQSVSADIIVETCGDSPLIDHRHVDALLDMYVQGGYEYVSNSFEPTFPIGFDVKVFSTEALAHVEKISKDPYVRDNVSPYFYQNPDIYKCGQLPAEDKMHRRDIRLTLDYKEDYELLNTVFEKLLPVNEDFSAEDVIALFEREPELTTINNQYTKDLTGPKS